MDNLIFRTTATRRGWKHSKIVTVELSEKEAKEVAIQVLRQFAFECKSKIEPLEKERDDKLSEINFLERKIELEEKYGFVFPEARMIKAHGNGD